MLKTYPRPEKGTKALLTYLKSRVTDTTLTKELTGESLREGNKAQKKCTERRETKRTQREEERREREDEGQKRG